MKLSRITWALGLVALTRITGLAAAHDNPGWYIGGNLGQSRSEIDDERIRSALLGAGFTSSSISDDDRDLGYKLLTGYQFNEHFALEGGYFDLGKFSFTAATQPPGTLNGQVEIIGLNLDPVGILPLTEKLSAFARVGVNYAQTRSFFSGTGAVTVPEPRRKEKAINYKFGLGLQYDLTESLGLRAEAERYRIDDSVGNDGNVDLLSLGLVYRFFGHAPAAAQKAVAAAPAAAPAPVLVIAPAPAATERYCSILDIQFEIEADEIQREAQEKIAVVATFMNKYPKTTAVIEGHSDDVGDTEYNIQLSQRRAESVVNYLVSTFNIASSRLKAVGFGETRPLASNSTEIGKRLNRRIGAVIACATDIEGLSVIPARITVAMEMEFDRNKAAVKPQYREELRKVAKFMKANPAVTATVEGHTGNVQMAAEQSMEISQRRAQNVVDYLVDHFDVARARLSAEGFGQTRRFAYNTSAEGPRENRRVNIIINYAK